MSSRRYPAVSTVDHALINAVLRRDFGTFVAKGFQTLVPGDVYLSNWHVDAIVYRLMRVARGECHRLIVTQPPRSLKSICTSVALPAFLLGHDPSRRIACVSYSLEIAATFHRQFRSLVTSGWYANLFPGFRLAKDTEGECVTTTGGGRFVVPVSGSFTGRGADLIIIDDPLKADEAQSELGRRTVNEWFATALISRLNDKRRGAIVLVMQRLHEDDLAGTLLKVGGWDHLDLPAIAEVDEDIPIGPKALHARKKGDVLHPQREPIEALEAIKREMGSLRFSAQYQQRPVPTAGNLIRREWVRWYEAVPDNTSRTVQSWDVASTISVASDWSVCTTWLIDRRDYYLLDVWRDRLEFPALKRQVAVLANEYRPSALLIEKVGPGLHLLQELRADPIAGVPSPVGIMPQGDKLVRMEAHSARFEAGQVRLPREASWLADFLHELLAFPNGRHDDQIDSVSQFLQWAETRRTQPRMVPLVIGPKFSVSGKQVYPEHR